MEKMKTETGKIPSTGSRSGPVKNRIQIKNPVTGRYVKIDTRTGRIIDHKKSKGPYKGIREK